MFPEIVCAANEKIRWGAVSLSLSLVRAMYVFVFILSARMECGKGAYTCPVR